MDSPLLCFRRLAYIYIGDARVGLGGVSIKGSSPFIVFFSIVAYVTMDNNKFAMIEDHERTLS